jgi:hypothetical protein
MRRDAKQQHDFGRGMHALLRRSATLAGTAGALFARYETIKSEVPGLLSEPVHEAARQAQNAIIEFYGNPDTDEITTQLERMNAMLRYRKQRTVTGFEWVAY